MAKAHLGLWKEVDEIMDALRALDEKCLSQSSMTRLIRMASNAKRPDTCASSWRVKLDALILVPYDSSRTEADPYDLEYTNGKREPHLTSKVCLRVVRLRR